MQDDDADFLVYPPESPVRMFSHNTAEIEAYIETLEFPPPPTTGELREPLPPMGYFDVGVLCGDWKDQADRFHAAFKMEDGFRDILVPKEMCPEDTDVKRFLNNKLGSLGYTHTFVRAPGGKSFYKC